MRPAWNGLTPKEVVALVDETRERVGDNEKLPQEIVVAGLTPEEADDAIDTLRSAYFQAAMITAGMTAEQFSSDADDDPIFREALLRAKSVLRPTAPAAAPGATAAKRPWWKFW